MIAELQIDLGAIRRNVAVVSAAVAPARYAAVVKSNAYGHGLVEVSRTLASTPDVSLLCVYAFDEAAALRDAGVTKPILVLGPLEARDLHAAIERDVAITLWSDGAFLRSATRAAADRHKPLLVHAKIDSGVTRLGLDADRAAGTIASYLANDGLAVVGAFTHLAAAEELESRYTLEQLERFEAALAPIDALLTARNVRRHAAASAAAMLYPKLRLDLVRAGIATYGIWPSPLTRDAVRGAIALEPALSWTSELVVVREIEAGRSVGYGCTFHATRPSRIGVIPIGYAEGIPRAASNRGVVLVEGVRVPIVGRVCMNMTFVDVTDVPLARAKSCVTLIGRDGEEHLDANEFAASADTIGYEIVARLPAAVPRRFIDRG